MVLAGYGDSETLNGRYHQSPIKITEQLSFRY